MKRRSALLPLTFLTSWALLTAGAAAAPETAGIIPDAASGAGSIPGILLSTALANLFLSFVAILILVGGLYAYASLARFAPYHSWIYLYLVSLTGIVWAIFLLVSGLPVADPAFILITVVGLNLIVHILRFDRIQIPPIGHVQYVGSHTG